MIGVYGATGKVGRLVTARFDCAGARTILIGRNQSALSRLSSPGLPRPIAVAAIDDPSALERALDGCHVLVNCATADAGGERLVRAALDAGIHYVDAASEQHHIRRIFEQYDDEARQCDVAIVPALGFDYAVGDCLAHLAAQSHQPASQVVVAYAVEHLQVSGNSTRPASTATAGTEVVYREGRWRTVPFEVDRAWFDFPEPVGRRQMSRYGSGEVVTVPRHVKTQSVNTLITSTSLCPYPTLLPFLPWLRPIAGLVKRTPARAIFSIVTSALGGERKPSAGVDVAAAESSAPVDDGRFVVAVEAHATSGSVGHAIAAGANFREVTAAILAQGALWLEQGSVVAGVHSAATAFEPHALLDSLANEGVAWSQS